MVDSGHHLNVTHKTVTNTRGSTIESNVMQFFTFQTAASATSPIHARMFFHNLAVIYTSSFGVEVQCECAIHWHLSQSVAYLKHA